jgi:hypothetical protein
VSNLGKDGTCAFRGLPDGEWTVRLEYEMPLGAGTGMSCSTDLGKVTLPGEREGPLRFEADLSPLALAELEGTAFVDGAAIVAGKIEFWGRVAGQPIDRDVLGGAVEVGKDGTFVYELVPGEYTPVHDGFRGERFTIRPGQTLQRDLHFRRK